MTIYKDQLQAVYKLIEKPENWTQGFFARDKFGDGIDDDFDVNEEGESLSDEEQAAHLAAVCWCLYGAAYKCGIYADREYERVLGVSDIHGFNDDQNRSHAEVLALLASAIERAPEREVTT